MTEMTSGAVWRMRLSRIDSAVEEIRLPQNVDGVSQDEEWCEVVVNGKRERVRFHDYADLFSIPGLYEEIFYERLKCCSPSRVAQLLEDILSDVSTDVEDLTVLDVGAGNGMVGDELAHRGVQKVVGVDIIEEAREATLRDRPDVYDDYIVTDLTDLPEEHEEQLRRHAFNCMTTVAALGFGDIPPAAFVKALDLLETPGWLAFNIKEDFLKEQDSSGFSELIRQLCREEFIQPQAYRRYRHRISITGEPLYYVAMVAKKLRDLSDSIRGRWG